MYDEPPISIRYANEPCCLLQRNRSKKTLVSKALGLVTLYGVVSNRAYIFLRKGEERSGQLVPHFHFIFLNVPLPQITVIAKLLIKLSGDAGEEEEGKY